MSPGAAVLSAPEIGWGRSSRLRILMLLVKDTKNSHRSRGGGGFCHTGRQKENSCGALMGQYCQ